MLIIFRSLSWATPSHRATFDVVVFALTLGFSACAPSAGRGDVADRRSGPGVPARLGPQGVWPLADGFDIEDCAGIRGPLLELRCVFASFSRNRIKPGSKKSSRRPSSRSRSRNRSACNDG